ncbi:MAG: GGDEF domain-containing phosphodiesterase [Steroidobacteraceae bacterium]
MIQDSLIQALPDLVAFVRRDGLILKHVGGKASGLIQSDQPIEGRHLQEIWPDPAGKLLTRMVRRALTDRQSVTARFEIDSADFEAKVSAHGRERALCVIRKNGDGAAPGRTDDQGSSGRVERRGFLERLRQSVTDATLRERRLAICMVHIEGIDDISRIIDFSIGDQVMSAIMARLPESVTASAHSACYIGQLSDQLLVAVFEDYATREYLRDSAQSLCRAIAEPVGIGDARFELSAAAGIAVLGEDTTQARALLDHARAAMLEARREGDRQVRFYSDTLRMLPVARLDFERELREAIAAEQLALRYCGRYDMASGDLVAIQAYLRWPHPLRGEVRPAQFLPIAENTGLATRMSQWALARLRLDLPAIRAIAGDDFCISFGALRQHLAGDQLASDVKDWLRETRLAPERLELRIAERALASLSDPARILARLSGEGNRLVVDELGSAHSSIAQLAALPLHGLQVDRAISVRCASDPVARRAATAIAALAKSFGCVPISNGIDHATAATLARELGFEQGMGDYYEALPDLHDPSVQRSVLGANARASC